MAGAAGNQALMLLSACWWPDRPCLKLAPASRRAQPPPSGSALIALTWLPWRGNVRLANARWTSLRGMVLLGWAALRAQRRRARRLG